MISDLFIEPALIAPCRVDSSKNTLSPSRLLQGPLSSLPGMDGINMKSAMVSGVFVVVV